MCFVHALTWFKFRQYHECTLTGREENPMKRVLLTLPVLLSVLLFTATAFAMKNEPESFQGIPWGAVAPEKNFVEGNKWGLVKASSIDKIGDVYFRSESEPVFIEKVKITSPIRYLFHDDYGFAAVLIEFNGRADYDLIRKACIENWGQPDSDSREKSEKSGSDVIISLWLGENVMIYLNSPASAQESGNLIFGQSDYVLEVLVEPD